ncbi:GIY-YIG nuclease family protein [Phenylobacterium sp.]|uniref:GIY-YIG nuclease family protein n=1 Tax=Phenylobacterium sp. TaxID=1871053 RepID=UPI0035AEECF7
MTYWVYMLASRRHGALYVGVTNSLGRRVAEHREKAVPGFTRRYAVDRLVWSRAFQEVAEAIRFEKRLKRWRREWKVRLIEADNPHWHDLGHALLDEGPLHPDIAAALAAPPSPPTPPVIPVSAPAEDRDP